MAFTKYGWQNKHPEYTDEELIIAFQSNHDGHYIGELFHRYTDLIFGLCLKYLQNTHDSEDASYEIFETLIVKLKTNNVTHFKSWLYRVASNHCIDKIRKKKKNIIITLDDKDDKISDILDYSDTHEKEALLAKIDYCLSTLNEDQKMCIDLFYFQEKSYQYIAESMNISWSATRSYIQNGKRNLKNCMDKNDHRRI
ncbi:MAG TPA: sigma-70 family RNA polymerase sigma factor [Saprospiraceae bacterium]|nr:sigma-70 family RNA polymerase sigma factor [Saprospiraceae bacterium]